MHLKCKTLGWFLVPTANFRCVACPIHMCGGTACLSWRLELANRAVVGETRHGCVRGPLALVGRMRSAWRGASDHVQAKDRALPVGLVARFRPRAGGLPTRKGRTGREAVNSDCGSVVRTWVQTPGKAAALNPEGLVVGTGEDVWSVRKGKLVWHLMVVPKSRSPGRGEPAAC